MSEFSQQHLTNTVYYIYKKYLYGAGC